MPLTRERSDIPYKKSSGEGSIGSLGGHWVNTWTTPGNGASAFWKPRGREKSRDERRKRERELSAGHVAPNDGKYRSVWS